LRPDAIWVSAIGLAGSALLTLAARRLALAQDLLDVPNARSSHRAATPRGGGAAIAAVTTLAMLVLMFRGSLTVTLGVVIAVGGLGVAAIGFVDDRRPLPSSIRLLVHVAAAIWAVAWLGGLPPLRFGEHVVSLGWTGYLLALLGIVWVLNLFNFMDGIDGIAASEAMFVVLAGGWLTTGPPGLSDVSTVGLVLAAACGGFLLWNWPPARIFLGDVGSGYLGYVIAVLALAAAHTNTVALWVWLILGGAFFVDATATLLRRVLRGERVYEAHRSHAYQWLARRWGSHRRVTVALLIGNLVWLLPWAALAAHRPSVAAAAVVGALVPLAVAALAAGSGRSEHAATDLS
jgi:Fuc2NAc and GlcNAc transferase